MSGVHVGYHTHPVVRLIVDTCGDQCVTTSKMSDFHRFFRVFDTFYKMLGLSYVSSP